MADLKPKTRGNYYDPPTHIKDVPGVTRRAIETIETYLDEYSGTAEALAEAGLLSLAQFPGMPGQNSVSAELRPRGIEWKGRGTPGHMRVCRQLSGQYRILLTVSADAQARRRGKKEAAEKAADAAAEAVLRHIPAPVRNACGTLVEAYGRYRAKQCLRDSAWLARGDISPSIATQLLRGLQVFDQAAEAREVELRLAVSPMDEASALITRVSGRLDKC